MPRLRRSSCAAPGIARRRRGRGFEYRDPAGELIDDPEVLQRVAALAIPPAWREVWICMDPRGHLQATGIDAAGRKQYRYHDQWRAHRDRQKFDSMIGFGDALPRMRRRVARDLRLGAGARVSTNGGERSGSPADERLSRDRVLACSVRLLDLGFFRIGSEDYAERNESFGLTTMLREHVTIAHDLLVFDFPAKSGQRRVQAIADGDALAIVADLKRRRSGSQLLAYREGALWSELRAEDVNDYIKRASGGEYTAKDFRTWNATVLAAVALAAAQQRPKARAARDRAVAAAIKTVAAYLGNTPAVCRASYVDPRVIDRYHAGATIGDALRKLPAGEPDLADARIRRRVETAVLELLADAS
ncbi:MAG TPA: DNA topoisomerase IB [Solirubrobacteraceae bacterium]|jgi:DNA topoisomerase IB|nr:DNA topoisomerase IB [Solirubrobacteraceae bacterium]